MWVLTLNLLLLPTFDRWVAWGIERLSSFEVGTSCILEAEAKQQQQQEEGEEGEEGGEEGKEEEKSTAPKRAEGEDEHPSNHKAK